MTECNGCGDCCESFPLNTPQRADVFARALLASPREMAKLKGGDRKTLSWMANLTPVAGPFRAASGELRYEYSCPRFDASERRCTDYANRPAVCRNFPFYGRDPQRYPGDDGMSPRCAFNADKRTTLPIVAIR